jgi:hypothetical protein
MIIKHLFTLLTASLLTSNAFAQLPFSKDARSKRDFDHQRENAIENGFDIVPFPGEHPENVKRSVGVPGAQGVTNWGYTLLLPDDLLADIKEKCKNKVTVKVMDSGDPDHPYLNTGKLTASNYTADPTAADGNGHGTHVAGIIAAREFGILSALVDLDIVRWKSVKVLNTAGSGDFNWVANGIKAEDMDNKTRINAGEFVVFNGSFGGGTGKIPAVEDALKASTNLGVVYFFAAGNTGGTGVIYPANSEYGIACAALNQNLTRANFSTMGPEVIVGEPGVGIKSTYLKGTFADLSGTSMATPFLTSLGAIAISRWGKPLADYQTMRKYLIWIASDLPPAGKDDQTGYGIAYIRAILDKNPADMSNTPPPPPGPPAPPARAERILTYQFAKPKTIYWNILSAEKSDKANTAFRVTKKQLADASVDGLKPVTISAVKISVKSTTDATIEYDRLLNNFDWFFNNRGFGLTAGSDYADVVYWTGYFFEMMLETQRPDKQKVDVLEISGSNETGKPVVWSFENLRHFPQLK